MADKNSSTGLSAVDVVRREVFTHLQFKTFFEMLANEAPDGEAMVFETLGRLIDNGLVVTALKKGDPKEDDTEDRYAIPTDSLKAALARIESLWTADDDTTWRIVVDGIPEGYYRKLGALWVARDDYEQACARLQARQKSLLKYLHTRP